MKKITFAALTIAFAIHNANAAPEKTQLYGPVTFTNKQFDQLSVKGPTNLTKVTLGGTTEIYGPFTIADSTIKNLKLLGPLTATKLTMHSGEITGPANFTDSTVNGKLTITGPLEATGTTFKDRIDIQSTEVTLDNSNAGSIHFLKSGGLFGKGEEAHLNNNANVNGDITFDSGKGVVYIEAGSKLNGSVKGGKIMEKSGDNAQEQQHEDGQEHQGGKTPE